MNAIAISVYGTDPKYLVGAIRNGRTAQTVYPGWDCIFYVASDVPEDTVRQLANVGYVRPMGKAQGSTGMFWRFLAASSRNVEYAIFRDADSTLNIRESAAVAAWVDSGLDCHAMHDHIHHRIFPLHGGMWGIRGGVIMDMAEQIAKWSRKSKWGDDQHFLRSVIWPRVKGRCLRHARADLVDSKDFPWPAVPFPDHGVVGGFVGEVINPEDERFNQ